MVKFVKITYHKENEDENEEDKSFSPNFLDLTVEYLNLMEFRLEEFHLACYFC